VGQHSSASASRLLGLDGFEVVTAEIVGGEWQLEGSSGGWRRRPSPGP
jgi:hypothetical protein